MESPLIELKNVRKSFGKNAVLQGVSLAIQKGEITAIIGKSGEGKSVLLKHIIGLIHADKGTILYNGKPFDAMNRQEKKDFHHRISYMFQGTALFDSMTVYDNIALPLVEKHRLSKESIREKVRMRLEQLDLVSMEDRYPSQLSGGMMKRVALARALVTDPEVVLFDEPTTGLDPIRKNAVHNMIADYQRQIGFTAVVVSHEIPDIFSIAQHILMLDEGEIIFSGTPDEIQTSQLAPVRRFIRGEATLPAD